MKNINLKSNLYLVIFLSFLTACTDVIDVDVPDAGPRLIVQAAIDWEKGTPGNNQTIYLKTSKPYFDSSPSPVVTGASVTITKDNDGTVFEFTDQNDGRYTTSNFIPEIGTSYTLNIVSNGESYEAKETLIGFTEITKVTQEDGFTEEEYRVRVSFNDPEQEENYYLGEFIQENVTVPSLRAVRDEFVNGNEAFILHFNENNTVGTAVDIRVFGISKQYYFYIEELITQAGAGGGPFQAPPAQLKGNCINITNPEEEVLGYFRLSQFERTSYTIVE